MGVGLSQDAGDQGGEVSGAVVDGNNERNETGHRGEEGSMGRLKISEFSISLSMKCDP